MPEHTVAIFVAELILLLFTGRMLGEGMARMGQPAIFGQLLAGVLLGPSVFGAFAPGLRQIVFPGTEALKSMLDAISQIGILLLLLLTGMETNLSLVNRKRRAVVSTSVFGIAVPFVCGVVLAYVMPSSLMPDPAARLVTALFLGTALAISSVKIVAMVFIEVGAIRRDLGQLILATAILDDTIAWIIIAVIAGIATHGTLSFGNIGASVAATGLFLALSLSVGRRLVARVIRWSNDSMTTEVPVITAILVVMLCMALSTELIGVHTALGAFVAGILVGQSPILTEHIEGELRGFIIAFFSPVFFAVAGLGMDLRTLLDPMLLLFTIAVIAVASLGKFLGALIGGRVGGLSTLESLALATGLNARGSTEVIIASIGVSLGALSTQLYTMIVAMAIVTTMAMPPTLRWMLARAPLREEEAKRLEMEEAEAHDSVPKMERALVYVDEGANGKHAALLAGMFATERQILATLMRRSALDPVESVRQFLAHATLTTGETSSSVSPDGAQTSVRIPLSALVQHKATDAEDAVQKEIGKGYDIAFIGIDEPISETSPRFEAQLQALVEVFDGPIAIMLNGSLAKTEPSTALKILVPTSGTPDARLSVEIALVLAKASGGALSCLHVFNPREDTDMLRGRARRQGMAILVDARRLGKRSGIPVDAVTTTNARPEAVIRRHAQAGRYDLVIIGTSLRTGHSKFLGTRSAALARTIHAPVLLVVS